MRRKTKPRVVWLPRDPGETLIYSDGSGLSSNIIQSVVAVAGPTPFIPISGAIPVTIDSPASPAGSTTLSDIENSGYRLRRIVGKCFVSYAQDTNDAPSLVLATGTFIVLRVDDLGLPLASNLNDYNPHNNVNDDNPWIWQRHWILQNANSSVATLEDYPFTNAEYGSVSDGPHIDQKTARIIGPDERLFFLPTALNLTSGMAQAENSLIFTLVIRVLASMRTSSGNRRNASR